MSPLVVASVSLLAILLMMLAELRLSQSNERRLRQQRAIEPPGDVYNPMRLAYPLAFVAMAAEGAVYGPQPGVTTVVGVVVFAAAKALKVWAIASLGYRWTFRVLVLPAAPLVISGPYAYLRHPNYVGVLGELVGMALLVGARITGPVAVLFFALLLRRRIAVEEAALRHPPCT